MKRRELLCACAGCTPLLAGCTAGSGPVESDPRHPFADGTVSVRIDNRSDTDHDVERNAREALEYWEENAEQYVDFGVEFDVVEADPDMTIAYTDTPEPCRDVEGYSELVLGCAPLITPGRRVPEGLSAYVVAANRPFGKVRITTKHELGHVLGLYHDAEPRAIMSNRPEDRIPLYETRIDIWEDVLEAQERSNDGTRLFDLGVESWNDRRCEAAESAFDAANDEFTGARELVDVAIQETEAFVGHPQVETVALEDLRTHLGRLRDRTAAAERFTAAMVDASIAASMGDRTRANEHLDAANEGLREFNDIGSIELRAIAVSLGLVRGFDRDEPVVEVDEEVVEA